MASVMVKVMSKDGTPIAFWRSGTGPPLVLVHGTSADHTRWPLVLSELEKHFTVHAVDRRGRGGSGDTEPYALEREFEDVAAVVDAIDGPVCLLGHSYGAQCCLEASLRTANLHKLVVYEPDIFVGEAGALVGGVPSTDSDQAALSRIDSLLLAGDREGVVTTFLREFVGMTDQMIESSRAQPGWEGRVAAAHTIPRELRAPDTYRLDSAQFKEMRAPTLLLVGGDSPPWAQEAAEAIAATLPDAKVAVMPGQGHIAMNTAPELFLREVIGFLKE